VQVHPLDGFACGVEFDGRIWPGPPPRADNARRLPVTPPPDRTESAYRRSLKPLIDDLRERTAALLDDLDRYTAVDNGHVDAPRRMSPAKRAALEERLAAMKASVLERWSQDRIVKAVPLEEFVEAVDRQHQLAMSAQIGAAIKQSAIKGLPADATAWVKANDGSFSEAKRDRWATANARLITKIAARHVERIADVVEAGMSAGSRASVIAARIKETTRISARRAAGLARDQVASLQGQVVAARQTRLGVTRYRWRTVGDSRVRTAHSRREGQIFSWKSPPSDGHPGQPINCRCTAEPVLDDVLADLVQE
jgi:SPP1 gp7 family putative phage head morphogenesis protein